jgi:hypothetical protein
MSQAINTHTASTAAPPVPSRRSALRFIVAAIDAGMTLPILASPTPNKDAKLPRLCAAFRTQHRLVLDLAKAGGNAPDDALDWAMIERWGISDKIRTTPARTDGGKKAKSEVAIRAARREPAFRRLRPRHSVCLFGLARRHWHGAGDARACTGMAGSPVRHLG